MNLQKFDILTSHEIFLANGEISPEIKIEDKNDENLYLTFKLNYIANNIPGRTRWHVIDDHHVSFSIDTRPNSVTEPAKLIEIGTMDDGTPIYIGFMVQAQLPQTEKHQITVNIYTLRKNIDSKEEASYGV